MMRSTNGLQRLARLAALRAHAQQQQATASAAARCFSALPAAAAAEAASSSTPVNAVDGKVLHPSLLNANLRKTQYAVRGEL